MMADAISSLLGLGIDDDAQTRALAEQLRKRKQASDWFGISTVEPLAQGAQQESQDVMAAAQTAGGLRRAMQEREQQAAQAQLGRDFTAEQNEINRAADIARDEATRAENLRQWAREEDAKTPQPYQTPDGTTVLAKMQGGQLVDRNGIPISTGSVPFKNERGSKPASGHLQGYMKTLGLDEAITSLDGLQDTLSDTAKAQLNNTVGDTFLDIGRKVLPGQSADLMARNSMYTDPQAQQAMEMFARLESEVMEMISGKQITGIEAEKVNKWSPNAAGLTLDQRIRRAKNLQERLSTNMNMFETTYPDWNLRGQSQTGGIEYLGVEE